MLAQAPPSGRICVTPRQHLVSATTEDGLELSGLLIQPEHQAPLPVLLWIHGFGANFYLAPYLRLADAVAAHGVASFVVNTRGHDLATLLQPKSGVPYWGGAAWEKLDESPRDLAAWVAFAVSAGSPGVVLVGHSLGAVKVTYYLAERRDERVLGLVLLSPPLRPTWDTRAYPAALAEADRLVRAGHDEALIDGPWGPVSAQTYLAFDRVGFDQFGRATPEPSIARIRCPVLAVVGTEDIQVCSAEDLEMLRRNARAATRVDTHVIDGGDHFFTGQAAAVAELLAIWIDSLSSMPEARRTTL
jgi:pimeloyl-ACP methyl ester carboxylesterase